MIAIAIKPEWILYGVGAGLGLLALNSILGGRLFTAAAETIARAPADAFIGTTSGFLGLPDTRTAESVSRCQAAIDAGNDWEASFYCPAAGWLKGVFDGR